jgi:hypothetical protein
MTFIPSFTEIIKILIPLIGQHVQLVNRVPKNETLIHQNPNEHPATRHNDWLWLYVTLNACWHAATSREVWVTAPSLLIYHPRLLHIQLQNTRRHCTGVFHKLRYIFAVYLISLSEYRHIASDDRMTDELDGIWKETADLIKLRPSRLFWWTAENHEKPPVPQQRFEPNIYRIKD